MQKDIETVFNYCEKDRGFFSSNEGKWIRHITKLAEEYPDEVRVIARPENNDGTIYVELPTSWLKIQPKRKVVLTDEQRDFLRERMLAIRAR